ncbi:MAG: hypothetical protein IE889_05820 [Campylobacterales bacterium]|nr:hypothetical protein [Campylobacterales bacterium]
MKKLTVLSVIAASLLLVGCGEESKPVAKAVAPAAVEQAAPAAEEKSMLDQATEAASSAVKATKEAATDVAEKTAGAVEATANVASDAVKATKEAAQKVADTATEAVEAATETVAESVNATTEAVSETVAAAAEAVAPAAPAVNLSACAACHGANFETSAMGVSKVVKDMSQEDIVAALKGYKAGTYGGNMKAIMQGQIASFDDAMIDAAAAQIKGN